MKTGETCSVALILVPQKRVPARRRRWAISLRLVSLAVMVLFVGIRGERAANERAATTGLPREGSAEPRAAGFSPAALAPMTSSVASHAAVEESGADYRARCASPGVIRCVGFDSPSDIRGHVDPNADGSVYPVIDNMLAASGGGSLKFTVPSHSTANSSGQYWTEFADDLSVQFGAGQEFYIQWRQRFSPEMFQHFKEGNGWKQAIIGEGSRPGHIAYSCTPIEIVVENTFQVGAPRMYHSCGVKDGHYEGLEVHSSNGWLTQNALNCSHDRIAAPPCFKYKPNEWMTFQVHIKIGTWYQNDKKYHQDSTVQLWVADEGKPSRMVIDFSPGRGTGYDLVNMDPAVKYGKIWLLPYDTNKDPSQDHPTAYTWYDELIISRQRIPDPR
jgi:hypothetical protein